MAKFIKVEHAAVKRVFVLQVSHIVGFYEFANNETVINTVDCGKYLVKGTPDDILKKIDE